MNKSGNLKKIKHGKTGVTNDYTFTREIQIRKYHKKFFTSKHSLHNNIQNSQKS